MRIISCIVSLIMLWSLLVPLVYCSCKNKSMFKMLANLVCVWYSNNPQFYHYSRLLLLLSFFIPHSFNVNISFCSSVKILDTYSPFFLLTFYYQMHFLSCQHSKRIAFTINYGDQHILAAEEKNTWAEKMQIGFHSGSFQYAAET